MADPRPLPHDLSAERGVIGSLLIQNSGYAKIADILQPRMMFRDAHRKILAVCYTLCERGEAADIITVKAELERLNQLEDVGGFAYLSSLVDGIPGSWNIRYYAEIVREKHRLVCLIRDVGQPLVQAGYDASRTSDELIHDASQKLTEMAIANAPPSQSVRDMMPMLDARIEQYVERQGKISGLPSGLHEKDGNLDLYTEGWQPGHLVVIAGQTSFGKSVLALNFATAIARVQQRVVYYSFEMRKHVLLERLCASLSEVPLITIRGGRYSTNQWKQIAAAKEAIHDLSHLEIKDSGSRDMTDIERDCRAIQADRGLAAIVIDTFQLMDTTHGDGRISQLAMNSRRFQKLATELGIVIFVVSQLTLDPKDMHREPQLEDFRECKSLSHDAHIAIMLHPVHPKEARSERPVIAMKGLIRKNREGPVGTIWLDFERDFMRFVPASEPVPVPKAAKAEKAKPEPLKSPATW